MPEMAAGMSVRYCTPEICTDDRCATYQKRERYNATVRENIAFAEHCAEIGDTAEECALWYSRAETLRGLLIEVKSND
jgi:hypothetical protein